MATANAPAPSLAYDMEGSGTPVVFLHGLTFDRRTWRPITQRLDGAVTSIAVDLPAHGDSGGEPTDLEDVAHQLHRLLDSLSVERPVVVGHSMSAGLAALYASAHPVRGVVMVDQATEVLPFAQMLHQIAPMLRGPAFEQVWRKFEDSLGLDRIPEPTRALVLATHEVRQDVVLGYWARVLDTEPADLQAWIDGATRGIEAPCLAVFGRPVTDGERARLERLPDAEYETWLGEGHFVHLVHPERFAERLHTFVERCEQSA
ncbi:alpha/beta hydrolase [Streptomyces sp. ICBB 8177]|uniref:alpha/beta fold hydrolase n=1 Tax=Streptomyces sp. ICBB 8177 TaxID=563922 RepID=UPI000D6728FD|nr:alpha/beta hydrolase [Streptomyces sp. ICBB 8177]PWI41037.1 alpha/beta hydrolase [Streptomyces sp. ICBB 8177]